ncbi:polypeptide N-acetylgalactosaminyltransferase 13-like isoform X2 [Tetranychus urticae]|uniref:polypeptide N-acetylgalactosaminyltransferase 13-like isoform X2 n=1 Tax=Tetranychus urticae TaxID=32264 RepID=UPI00077BBCD1|nr:polypeptide N-acetylgalactosaminyltransferase 13-like isoform X2 [Tetranychus urticae]
MVSASLRLCYKFFTALLVITGLCYTQYKLNVFTKTRDNLPPLNPIKSNVHVQSLFFKYKLNLYLSDSLSFDRFIADHRNPKCQGREYPPNLPSVSIIIVFHNEPWSVLLRTIKSLIDRSPKYLLKEILLIDDFSTSNSIKYNLKSYLSETINDPRIKLTRFTSRIGLIKGRNYGASIATGNILIFLDSHVEVNIGWLEPLVSRLAEDTNRVVSPIVDLISPFDFSYNPVPDNFMSGFTWKLTHFMQPLPLREQKRRKDDPTIPIKSPTTYGGIFAIHRQFFFKLGGHDPDMSYLSYESIDLSLWVWCCGGNIEIVPCSRVGHIHRDLPYNFPAKKESIFLFNAGRIVETWLRRYKMFYYLAFPKTASIDRGNTVWRRSHQQALNCKNFTWYLTNVYPETGFPLYYQSIGQIEHTPSMLCFDLRTKINSDKSVTLKPCRLNHRPDSSYYLQIFIYTGNGTIRCDNWCLTGSKEMEKLTLTACDYSQSQIWIYSAKKSQLRHKSTNLCAHLPANNDGPILIQCNHSLLEQKFFIRDNFDWDEGNRLG